MNLTPHFKLSEFTRSNTAQKLGLDNTPTDGALVNLPRTVQMLESVSAHHYHQWLPLPGPQQGSGWCHQL